MENNIIKAIEPNLRGCCDSCSETWLDFICGKCKKKNTIFPNKIIVQKDKEFAICKYCGKINDVSDW